MAAIAEISLPTFPMGTLAHHLTSAFLERLSTKPESCGTPKRPIRASRSVRWTPFRSAARFADKAKIDVQSNGHTQGH